MTTKSLLRFTKSMAKLGLENDAEEDDFVRSYLPPRVTSFAVSTSSAPSSPLSPSSLSSLSPSNSLSSIPPSLAIYSPPTSPPSKEGFASESPSKKSAPRRMLTREPGSRNLPLRQIKQEGTPTPAQATLKRKDTISVWDWFRALDEEVEKERSAYGTMRGTSRTLRPTKSKRINENFEDFVKQFRSDNPDPEEEEDTTPFIPVKSKSMSVVHNDNVDPHRVIHHEPSKRNLLGNGKKTIKKMPSELMLELIDENKKEEGVKEPAVEVTPPPPVDESSLVNMAVMQMEIAEDDESLKVFLEAWNQLDTLEEQLCVQEELAEAAEEKLQLAQEEVSIAVPDVPTESMAVPAAEPAQPAVVAASTPQSPVKAEPTAAEPTQTPPSPQSPAKAEPTTTEPAKPATLQVPQSPRGGPMSPSRSMSYRTVSSPRIMGSPRSAISGEYKGPHYKGAPTQEFVEALLQYCADEGLSAQVPYPYVRQVVLDAMEIFRPEATIMDIPLTSKVVVIGDIHGQFPDLITILRDTGLPGPGQTLIFNGDFVDRGPAGVEVLLALYVMKICWPKYIFLHRGNHELESINRKYNFAEQVIKKYDEELFMLIQDSFALLPLGSVIANKVLVIHGGLPDEPTSIGQLRLLPKVREDPTKAVEGPEKLIQGILWSDPRDRKGTKTSKRGAGVEFGPDVTAAFMARSNLDLIVRSHEMVEEGFKLTHDGAIMTIFSASYYCGVSTNKGAFAVFTAGSDLKTPSIVQYYAQAYAARDNVLKSCVKDTLEKLREMIFANRQRLCLEFSRRDSKCTGKVTKQDWCEAMTTIMGVNIGWHGMLPYLAKVESDGHIVFIKFLDRYKITPKIDEDADEDEEDELDRQEDKIKEWQKETMGYMCINTHAFIAPDLKAAFTKFDVDADGKLSFKEFMGAIDQLKLTVTPPDEFGNHYYDMMRRIDLDEDGMLSYDDVEESLKPFMDRVQTLHKEDWIPSALIDLRAAVEKNFDFVANPKSRVKSAFRKCKAEGGKVQRRGFSDWIEKVLEVEKFSSVQKMRLALYVDFNNNGKISWREFKKVFWKPDYYNTVQENLFKAPSSST